MNRIKELCIQKGIEQKQLAMMVGVSQPTVSDWFNNKKNPRGERLDKLAEILNVSRAFLLGYSDDEEKKSPVTDEEIKFALFGGDQEITDAQFEEVKRFAQYVRERDRRDK